jgi:imidazole glycerol-phosphate synthase subunit HisH
MKIGVIDYEAGNLSSVETALRFCGIDYFVTDSPGELEQAERLIFPGVGEARAAMDVLKKKGLDAAVVRQIEMGKPFLGICIGYQILFDTSEERDTPCLGIISGQVRRFPIREGYKVPHMGWNEVDVREETGGALFAGIPRGTSFYFVHSYYPRPDEEEYVAGSTDYLLPFASCYRKDNVSAVQFHPEKSGAAGLRLLANFAEMKE